MKPSAAITIAIIAVAALAGWRNHGQLASVNLTYQQLRQQARALGIEESSTRNPTPRTRSRQPRQLDSGPLAVDLIAFSKELETVPESSDSQSFDEREQRILDWQRRLSALNPVAMKILIAEVHTAPASPNSVSLPRSMASCSVWKRSIVSSGPNTSSRTTRISRVQSAKTVGR